MPVIQLLLDSGAIRLLYFNSYVLVTIHNHIKADPCPSTEECCRSLR